jgi:hypothetical protein
MPYNGTSMVFRVVRKSGDDVLRRRRLRARQRRRTVVTAVPDVVNLKALLPGRREQSDERRPESLPCVDAAIALISRVIGHCECLGIAEGTMR